LTSTSGQHSIPPLMDGMISKTISHYRIVAKLGGMMGVV
jgi:hypothetical protein